MVPVVMMSPAEYPCGEWNATRCGREISSWLVFPVWRTWPLTRSSIANDWNNRQLLAPIGNIPPVEFEHHWTTTQSTEQAVNHDATDGVLT